MMSSPPEATIDRMVELYEAGLSLVQVAKEVHWSASCISRHLELRGVKKHKRGGYRGKGVERGHSDLTVNLYRQGYSINEVAEMMGLSPATIHYRLRRVAEPARGRSEAIRMRWARQPKKRLMDQSMLEEIAALYRSGLSSEDIAAKLGMSGNAVRWRLQAAGEPRRGRSEAARLGRQAYLARQAA